MLSPERINLRQATMLLVTALTSTGHLLFVRILAHYAGRDSWVALIMATLVSCVAFLPIVALAARFPGKNLVSVGQAVFGPIVGRAFGFIFILYFVHVVALLIRSFVDFLRTMMPQTPAVAIVVFILGYSVYASRKGVEVIARVNDIALPFLIVVGLTGSLLLHKDKHFSALLPILDKGWVPVLRGGLSLLGLYSEGSVFGMLGYCLLPDSRRYRGAIWGMVTIGGLFLGPVIGSITIFGSANVQGMVYPTFEELKYIDVADIFANLDIIGILLWTIGTCIKAPIFLWASATGLASLVNVEDHTPLIAPLSLIIGTLAFAIGDSSVKVQHFMNETYAIYGLVVGTFLPLLLLAWAWTCRLRGSPDNPAMQRSGASQ